MIIAEDISKRFAHPGDSGDETFLVLDDIRLTVGEGEIVSVLGPSGCGKTTLLRIVAGLESADAGQVTIDRMSPDAMRPHAGYLTQQNSLLPWLSAVDNVAFPLKMQKVDKANRLKTAHELLEQVGLAGKHQAWVHQLSGGMQQRVMLARLMAQTDRYWLLDEPFAALDEQTRMRLQTLLVELCRNRRTTTLLVTHSIEESVYLSDRILVMSTTPGRISETIEVNLPHPRDRLAPEFVELMNRTRRALYCAM